MTKSKLPEELSNLFDEFEKLVSSEDYQKKQKQFKKELTTIEQEISEIHFEEYLRLVEKEFDIGFCIEKFKYIKGAYCMYVMSFENIEFDDLNGVNTLQADQFYDRSNNSSSQKEELRYSKKSEIMVIIVNKIHEKLYNQVILMQNNKKIE